MANEILKVIEENKIKILSAVAVVLLVFAATYFVWKLLNRPAVNPPAYGFPKQIDFEILKNPIMKELEMAEEAKLPEEKGRENPFLPYETILPASLLNLEQK